MNDAKWYNSKTNRLAVVAILTTLAAYLSGEITVVTAVQSAVGALLAIFLRQGVTKSGPTV